MSKIVIVLVIILAIVGAVWLAKPKTNTSQINPLPAVNISSALKAPEANFAFGSISMKAGDVSHRYLIKNTGSAPALVTKIYTSCMCTTANLEAGGEKYGPFGMPGHGLMHPIQAPIAPGSEAVVEVIFDPAAHGPAGVGPVDRMVILETAGGETLRLRFTATVTP